jgi:hypothetical protein
VRIVRNEQHGYLTFVLGAKNLVVVLCDLSAIKLPMLANSSAWSESDCACYDLVC